MSSTLLGRRKLLVFSDYTSRIRKKNRSGDKVLFIPGLFRFDS